MNPTLSLTPRRQILHEKSTLQLEVKDPLGIPEEYRLKIYYNSYEITDSVLNSARLRYSAGGTQLRVYIPLVRLPPRLRHNIEFQYFRRGQTLSSSIQLLAPSCLIHSSLPLKSTGRFHPPQPWLTAIRRASKDLHLNPNLLAALVAQESSFNPRAVSPARAVGLTQITPSADADLENQFPDWPRDQRVETTPFLLLKHLISRGRIHAQTDWRLNPELSIHGGASYLELLAKIWSHAPYSDLVQKTFEDSESATTELVLASYNSGLRRVFQTLESNGVWYMDSADLRAARNYTRLISSYCYTFAHPEELSHENPS